MRLARKIEPERRRPGGGLPRSNTVGFGRIDEDKAFEFGDDDDRMGLVYPRSKSYAASTSVQLLP